MSGPEEPGLEVVLAQPSELPDAPSPAPHPELTRLEQLALLDRRDAGIAMRALKIARAVVRKAHGKSRHDKVRKNTCLRRSLDALNEIIEEIGFTRGVE